MDARPSKPGDTHNGGRVRNTKETRQSTRLAFVVLWTGRIHSVHLDGWRDGVIDLQTD